MNEMIPRERVLRAIKHKESDRVPIDIGGMRSTGIEATAHKRLRKHLNINDRPIKSYDVWQQSNEGSYGLGNARIPRISARLGKEHKTVRIPTAKYCKR